MKILAIDTTLSACSAAFWVNGTIVAKRFALIKRGHAERLLPMVEAVRLQAAYSYEDIDVLGVTVGPGTFTGVRIGLAAARGLALAAARPLIGITTLAAVAEGVRGEVREDEYTLVALDARRGEIYAQVFDPHGAPYCKPIAVGIDKIPKLIPNSAGLVVGTGVSLIWSMLKQAHPGWRMANASGQPNAIWVAELTARMFMQDGNSIPRQSPSPLYLRSSGARLPNES